MTALDPPAIRALPGGVVLLAGWAVEFAAYAVQLADADAQARGQSLSRDAAVLEQVLVTVAAVGRGTGERCPTSPTLDAYDTRTTAAVLGVAERTIRRHAQRLGGRLVGGSWLFRPATIEQLAQQQDWRTHSELPEPG